MSKILGKSHDRWRTPPEFFEVCDNEFHFGLDAAAEANNALCRMYINPTMDSLKTEWTHGYPSTVVWCNPPYSMIGEFVERAYEQSQVHKLTTVVLIPAYTDPKYWANYVMRAHEIRFLKGRLAFIDQDGGKKESARFPSVLVINKWIKGQCYGRSPNTFVWDWRADAALKSS